VKEFLRQGAEVELAVVKANSAFFREVFPGLRQRVAPSYNIVYPKYGFNMALWLLKSSAHLNMVVRYERRYAEEMVERHGYDVLFSDNRFGFYSKYAHSIYMTHQRRIAFPPALSAFEGIGIRWHRSVMKRFDEVWVPDEAMAPGYASTLSHVGEESFPLRFVGALSRFDEYAGVAPAKDGLPAGSAGSGELPAGTGNTAKKYRVVAVVSGVEPARSQFEETLRASLRDIPGKHLMVLGKPQRGMRSWVEGNIEFFSHMPTPELAAAVKNADWVVSRGGYSTVMDMACLGAKCIFVPTTGQYEQIYLAKYLDSAGYAVDIPFRKLSADSLLDAFQKEVSLPKPSGNSQLRDAVSDALRASKI